MNVNTTLSKTNQAIKPKGEIIVTDDGKKYQKAGLANAAGAVFVANMAGGATNMAVRKLSHIPLDNLDKLTQNLDKDTFKQAADKAFANSGLAEKGVKLLDATNDNKNVVKESLQNALPNWVNKYPKLKNFFNKKFDKISNTIISGRNACYIPRANTILINKDKMSWAAFHEMGHAMNKHMGGIGKVLHKLRAPMVLLTSVALFTALFKRKKAEGEKPEGFFDKTTTFIKENAGKLAFAGMVPTILEEGLASIKGAKLAKNLLSPENLKKLNNLNARALLTYIGGATAAGLSAFVISKVRDAIAAPKEIKE